MVNDRVRNGLPPLQAKSQPFLGVATGPLDPALAAQLGFTPGLGLIVEEVVPDGPAAKAGVQAFDVIKQINDQLVSNPAQLTALVNHFGKDADVSLLVLRKGQEQKITVKIGEHMARTSAVLRPEGFGGMPGFGAQPFGPRRDDNPGRQPRQSQDARPGRPSDELLQKVGPGAPPEVQTFQDRISTTWNTASARVMLKDANGEIEVRSENGKRTLTAKNPKGEVAFDGPIDTEEQRKAVPPEFRKMLEQVEVRSRIERRPGGPEGAIGSGGFGRAPGAPVEPKPRRGQPEVQ